MGAIVLFSAQTDIFSLKKRRPFSATDGDFSFFEGSSEMRRAWCRIRQPAALSTGTSPPPERGESVPQKKKIVVL